MVKPGSKRAPLVRLHKYMHEHAWSLAQVRLGTELQESDSIHTPQVYHIDGLQACSTPYSRSLESMESGYEQAWSLALPLTPKFLCGTGSSVIVYFLYNVNVYGSAFFSQI